MKERRNEVAPPCVVGVFLSSLWAVDYCDVTKEASVLLPRQTNEGKAVSNKHLRDSLTSEREMNKSLAPLWLLNSSTACDSTKSIYIFCNVVGIDHDASRDLWPGAE